MSRTGTEIGGLGKLLVPDVPARLQATKPDLGFMVCIGFAYPNYTEAGLFAAETNADYLAGAIPAIQASKTGAAVADIDGGR
jgi:hypothetical protein